MISKITSRILATLALTLLAQPVLAATDFKSFVNNTLIEGILTPVVTLLISAAVLLFVWGVVKFIKDEAASGKAEGRQFMIWSVVGLFVISAMWGIVSVIQSFFNLEEGNIDISNIISY